MTRQDWLTLVAHGIGFAFGTAVTLFMTWDTGLTINPVATFVLGAVTAIVGIVVFVGPHLRGLRDERIELRKANTRLTDQVRHLSRGTIGEDFLETGMAVIRPGRVAYEYPDGTIMAVGKDDGSKRAVDGVIPFDDIRDGGDTR